MGLFDEAVQELVGRGEASIALLRPRKFEFYQVAGEENLSPGNQAAMTICQMMDLHLSYTARELDAAVTTLFSEKKMRTMGYAKAADRPGYNGIIVGFTLIS